MKNLNLKLIVKNDIATIVFDMNESKVNILSFSVLEELSILLDEINKNKDLKVLLLKSAKKNNFIAGANIKEIQAFKSEKDVYDTLFQGHEVLNKLENLKIPSIAYINGSCLGGGLELVLACTYRIASTNDKTIFSFPEIKLGFFPGLAGTQRAPKLLGLVNALDLILSAKKIDAKKALRIKLVNEVFAQGQEEFKIKKFIENVINNKVKVANKSSFIEYIPFIRNIIYKKAYQSLEKKVNKDFKAPYKALEVIAATYKKVSFKEAIKLEAKEFSKLAMSAQSKYLINLFFTFEKLNKNYEKTEDKIESSVILGNGVMAKGIIFLFSKYLKEVRIKVRNLDQIQNILKDIFKIYDYLIKSRRLSKTQVDFNMNKISYTNNYENLKSNDLIIEAIVEDLDIKKQTYIDLEKNIDKNTIIASNTSSLSIEELSKSIENKKNFLGIHFFNPVNLMPLVEVIPSSHTSKETINRVFEVLISTGKTPILVKDCAGFIVNRLLLPYLNEAALILEEGSSIEEIDKTIKDFGMPMGPFTLVDTVGIDIAYKVSNILADAYGKRVKKSELISKLYELKLLGRKSGEGFYSYENKTVVVNPSIEALINETRIDIKKEEIIQRSMFIMINEAARCLEENIV
ncbi:MAG: enoyl-CoA hydratase/isomerase family protein [Campylobacteraceae bacterium]|nr:enoyl-CoA hydratase/isomerase family protein [Campylobacteraceae bacterium]